MGLKIIKPTYEIGTRVVTCPFVNRFFYQTKENITEEDTFKIDAAEFFDDDGEAAEALPKLNMNNSYFNVFINGILQMEENFAYTAGPAGIGNLMVSVPEGSEIKSGTPVILEVVNFEPKLI